ncbi:glycosyltransferase family 4 protein [soil metagenome]
MSTRSFTFVIPGDWATPTGGYRYDRHIVLAMREAGWTVDVVFLADGFPRPDAAALEDCSRRVSALANGSVVVVDGLAFGVLDELASQHEARLRFVALVHHPLHLETGLDPQLREQLASSETRALRSARKVIVPSGSTMGDVMAMGVERDRIAVVEPGTDRPARAAPDSSVAHVRLLCVATLVPRKGHAVLLEALAGLLDLDWTLDCVGSADRDPATAGRLLRMTTDLHLASRVRWLGAIDEPALSRQYENADLFVLPSFYEGFGMVVTEAVAHGLPVVTTTGGALARTLPAGAGLHVSPGDVEALREALRSVISDAALRSRLVDGARTAAEKLPYWADAALAFGEVIEGVK